MSDNLRRFYSIRQCLNQLYPTPPTGNLARHLTTLAAMISGIVGSRSTNLPKIADFVADDTKPESRVKKIYRFLKNDSIDSTDYFLPYAIPLITSLASLNRPLLLAIDGSVVGKGCMCLMISLLYKNRALPLCWQVVKQAKGHMSEALHIELFEKVKALIPEDCTAIMLGDGEFDGTDWLAKLETATFKYVCRTAIDSVLIEDGDVFNFKRLGVEKECFFAVPEVYFTQKGYGPLQAILWKESRYQKPVCLVTNMELAAEACYWYRKRFHIETFFSDQKSRGFNIHKSHLEEPERLHRLIMAAALAYIWIIYLGCLAMKEKWYQQIHRTDRCDYSLFRIGLKLLSHFLNQSMEIPVNFIVLAFDDPFKLKSVRD